MNILKWYIIKQWLKAFIGSFLVLFVLITVANLLTGLLRSNVTAGEVFANYIIQIFNYFSLIIPISSLTASVFSINKIKNKNELTAIFSLGLSRKAFMSYIFIASLGVGILSFLTLAFIKPKISSLKDILIKNPGSKFLNLKKKGLITSAIGSGYFWYKTKNYFVSYKDYNHNLKQLNIVSLYMLNKNGIIDEVTQAKKASYQDQKWISRQVVQITGVAGEKFNNIKIINNFTFPLIERPLDLLRLSADISTLNIVKLKKYINNLQLAGLNASEYLIHYYSTFNIIIICVLLAMIASIEIYTPNRRSASTGKSIGLIFLFTICYWLLRSYLVEMGKISKISPELAIFSMPVFILFLFILIANKHRKLT